LLDLRLDGLGVYELTACTAALVPLPPQHVPWHQGISHCNQLPGPELAGKLDAHLIGVHLWAMPLPPDQAHSR